MLRSPAFCKLPAFNTWMYPEWGCQNRIISSGRQESETKSGFRPRKFGRTKRRRSRNACVDKRCGCASQPCRRWFNIKLESVINTSRIM